MEAATLTERPELTLNDREFWAQDFFEREKYFQYLRDNEPVAYHEAYESTLKPPEDDEPGFYSLTRWEDQRDASRNAKVFRSQDGILMESFPEVVQQATTSFLALDAPRHTQLRGIVQKALSPRRIREVQDWIDAEAKKHVDNMIDKGEGDFCELFARELPGHIFADFFGVEQDSEDRKELMYAAEEMLAWDDPTYAKGRDALEVFAEGAERIHDVAYRLMPLREKDPQNDMISWLVEADFEGEKMDDWEVAAFCSLLASAANDTTRHSLTHAMLFFTKFEDQRALLMEDFDGRIDNAIEEVLRYSSPVMQFRRTPNEDVVIHDTKVEAGQKVVLWYCSGNFDDRKFVDPHKFDILREDVGNHLAFGAGGPHFCIGNALGRYMLKAGLTEAFKRMPDIEASDPVYQVNNFIHGIHELPVRWTPGGVEG